MLLERGADINARCVDHYSTPVQYLANGRVDVARHLFALEADADIFSTAMAGAGDVVEKLIRDDPEVLNAKINQETFPPSLEHDVHNIMTFSVGMGCGPLHAATKGNQPSIVDIIVDAGLSPDARGGYDDQTPLHLAAWNDYLAVASKLLDRGADINIRSGNIHHNSPAGWAIVAGSANVFELLMDRGAEVFGWFVDDAVAAAAGRFGQYKCVPPSNYERILRRLRP